MNVMCVFFFSSRRRHTRCSRDWSSDVCSSDLIGLTMYVPWRDGLDAEQLEELFQQDLRPVEAAIQRFVRVYLMQNQVDALASWIFNVGVEAFYGSTLLKRLNAADFRAVPEEMTKWIYAGGKILEDLKY